MTTPKEKMMNTLQASVSQKMQDFFSTKAQIETYKQHIYTYELASQHLLEDLNYQRELLSKLSQEDQPTNLRANND